jgi:hypothetical protein
LWWCCRKKAQALQQPLTDDALEIVASGTDKEDKAVLEHDRD